MTEVATAPGGVAHDRPLWRTVAIPTEHGGWGITLEPVLLGVIVAFSWSGVAIGLAAFLAFLVRTPLKLALVDRRRHRSLPRTRLAMRLAIIELAVLAAFVVRTQIARVRHGATSLARTDAFQVAGGALAMLAVGVDSRVLPGAGVVILAAIAQSIATRRSSIAAVKIIGLRQMAIGLAIVAATAAGALM